jgi:hypothetical protein
MKNVLSLLSLLGIFAFASSFAAGAAEEPMLAHDVYFSLKDRSPEAKEKLIAGCKKYLAAESGTVWFAAGPLAEELKREVNDRDFDVALHIVFKNRKAHDVYQKSENHLAFIKEFEATFAKVRVFDSLVTASAHAEMAQPTGKPEKGNKDTKVTLPDAADSFAGMIQGEVLKAGKGKVSLRVEKIVNVWASSKSKDPQSLIGKTVAVAARAKGDEISPDMDRFFKSLKPGEKITIDVAHQKGQVLTLQELTDEQRQRVKN